jgi:hypothetical protein
MVVLFIAAILLAGILTVFIQLTTTLKVPKRENFLLAFFALSEPIWVGDLGTKPKKNFL